MHNERLLTIKFDYAQIRLKNFFNLLSTSSVTLRSQDYAIPGGFKGMKFLHKHRLTTTPKISLTVRESAIGNYQLLHPQSGIPNLLISDLWKNEEYAEKVIWGAVGRLSAGQVRSIREYNELSIPIEKIVQLSGAKNVARVKGVLSGETYSRIH